MVGLPNNNNSYCALTKWHQLFTKQSTASLAEANKHWKQVEGLWLSINQNEYWKYIPLDNLLSYNFVSSNNQSIPVSSCNKISLKLNAYRLVFVNGFLIKELSDIDIGMWQINIEKGKNKKPLPDPIQSEIFLHLTESLSQETSRISLPPNKESKYPLYLLHISHGSSINQNTITTLQYRHHIDIGANARCQIIEHFVSLNSQRYFNGSRTSIIVGNNSHVNHIKLAFENSASYHFGHNDITLGQHSVVHSDAFVLGTSLSRHQSSIQLNGEGSNLIINSLLLPLLKGGVSNISTYLEHNKGYCYSRQLHKIIVNNRGKGVFSGLIKVTKHAIKTNSQMINKNLLLNRCAEIDTKPQLEIYSDDVQCKHGATIDQIDQEQIFYLRSRGISYDKAKQMIIHAFAIEIVEKINVTEIRNIILTAITEYLKGSIA